MKLFKPIKQEYINPYKGNINEVIRQYNIMSKRANQRMRALEKASKAGKISARYGAYEKVQLELGHQEGNPPKRFKERMTLHDATNDIAGFRNRFLELQNFLSAKSSTITGLKEIHSKREQTWKEKGIKFDTDEDFYNFLHSDIFKSLSEQFDSDTIVEIFDLMRESRSESEIEKSFKGIAENYKKAQKELSVKALKAMATGENKKRGFKQRR